LSGLFLMPKFIKKESIILRTEQFKVASNSKPNKVAGAITGALKDCQQVELLAIGANAVNQAVKAVAIASLYSAGKNLICVPGFCDVNIENETRTGIKFIIKVA